MKRKIIYLDNASTTRVRKEVIEEMKNYFTKEYGNPGSAHRMGEEALREMNIARVKIARSINASGQEIIFTCGATESNNMALFGIAKAYPKKNKIIISSIEHSSVYEPAMELKRRGYRVVEIGVNNEGEVDLNKLEREIDKETLIVSIMHSNNEFGTIQNIGKIGKMCRDKGAIFHTDSAQSFGKEKIDVMEMNIDLLSACAHKIGGPKGVGIIFVREEIEISPIILGGGQERGKRAGTENVAGIMGFWKSIEVQNKVDKNKIRKMRDEMIEKLEKIGGKINGSKERRGINNINVSFPNITGEDMVLELSSKGIMLSTRSACDSKKEKENRVLKAIGLRENEIEGAIRISINEDLKRRDIEKVFKEINRIVSRKK